MQGYISYDKSVTVNETINTRKRSLITRTCIVLCIITSIITFISHLHHQNVSYESSSLEADSQAVRDAVDEKMFDISTLSSIVTGR